MYNERGVNIHTPRFDALSRTERERKVRTGGLGGGERKGELEDG